MAEITQSNLSNRVNSMQESATIKMAQMARDLASKGHDVISLSLGEPDFDTPQFIKDAAKDALDNGFTKYTPVPGLPDLREAIVQKFKRDNDLEFDISQIVVSNGAKQSIANVCLSILDPGDEIVILAPYWVSYVEIVRLTEGIPVLAHSTVDEDFKISADRLEQFITDKTKALLFSSPCNPTGSVYTYSELQDIARMLAKYPNLTVISDEIYEYINFTGSHVSIGIFPEVADRTVTVNGFSKGFAMTGWRLGYMGAPKYIAKACGKIQGQFTSGANSFGQKAAAVALNTELSETTKMRDKFLERRNFVLDGLSKIPGFKLNKPMGAFYVFPDISSLFGKSHDGNVINNPDDFSAYILNSAHVGLVSGSAFGDKNCIRLSYAASLDELSKAIDRIKKAVLKLK